MRRPAFFFQLQALVAVAFKKVVKPQHDFGVNRLRTRIATPQAACNRGPPKQTKCADQHDASEENQFAGQQGDAKDVKFACGNVKQHRLAAIPLQPWQHIEHQLCQQHCHDAPIAKTPFGQFGMDAFAGGIKLNYFFLWFIGFSHVSFLLYEVKCVLRQLSRDLQAASLVCVNRCAKTACLGMRFECHRLTGRLLCC